MPTASQTLHRLTSYTWDWYEPSHQNEDLIWTPPVDDPRVVQGLAANDLDRLPWFYKRYPDSLPRLSLPRDLPTTTASAIAVLAGTAAVNETELDLAHLSRLLHLSAGVVRTAQRPYGTYLFRAAGSAGGRFPLELYVAIPDGGNLPAGVHHYDPLAHALVQVGPPPHADSSAGPAVIVTGVPWRTGWRYRERGYRHMYWDAGTMLSQLLAAAESAGIPAELYTRFPDADIASLAGATEPHEFPLAIVALSSAPPTLTAAKPATTGDVDADPLEFPLATAAQSAGNTDAFGEPWQHGAPINISTTDEKTLEAVALARGSQRRMDPNRGLSRQVLETSLAVALRGIDLPHWVVVHDVDGLAPGVYRWPDLTSPIRAGELRAETYRVCMEQALGRDAAFVVIAATDVSTLDDRGYREAQLGAGLVSGRLHLLAYALGASATGMTFIDSELPALLGEPADGLLFTCVGVPEYRSTAGGQPGAPTAVRTVPPRD